MSTMYDYEFIGKHGKTGRPDKQRLAETIERDTEIVMMIADMIENSETEFNGEKFIYVLDLYRLFAELGYWDRAQPAKALARMLKNCPLVKRHKYAGMGNRYIVTINKDYKYGEPSNIHSQEGLAS